jgi:hypothetical protein
MGQRHHGRHLRLLLTDATGALPAERTGSVRPDQTRRPPASAISVAQGNGLTPPACAAISSSRPEQPHHLGPGQGA